MFEAVAYDHHLYLFQAIHQMAYSVHPLQAQDLARHEGCHTLP